METKYETNSIDSLHFIVTSKCISMSNQLIKQSENRLCNCVWTLFPPFRDPLTVCISLSLSHTHPHTWPSIPLLLSLYTEQLRTFSNERESIDTPPNLVLVFEFYCRRRTWAIVLWLQNAISICRTKFQNIFLLLISASTFHDSLHFPFGCAMENWIWVLRQSSQLPPSGTVAI